MKRPALAILALLFLLPGCEQTEMKDPREDWVEVETGFKQNVARTNPFLAAERFLQEMGLPAEPHSTLIAPPEASTLLLLPAEAVRTPSLANNLVNWVGSGGHLIYLLEGGDSFANDFSRAPNLDWDTMPDSPDAIEARMKADHPLLWDLEIELGDRESATNRIRMNGVAHDVEIPSGKGFDIPSWLLDEPGRAQAGPRDARGFSTFPYGNGRLTLIADGRMLRNRFLEEKDHAQLLWNLVNLEANTTSIWLVRGTGYSFWSLLWQHGWMPLLSLMVLILFWLWKSMPRFGPLVAEPAPSARDFSEHLQRTGLFLWRHRAAEALLEPIQQRIRRRAHDRLLLDTSGDAASAIPAIAERAQLSEDRVRELLDHPAPKDGHQFTRMVRDLQNLEQQT